MNLMENKCSFCGSPIELGTGKMFVRSDGNIYFFCSSKCENNFALGRVSRKTEWVRKKLKKMAKNKPKERSKKKADNIKTARKPKKSQNQRKKLSDFLWKE